MADIKLQAKSPLDGFQRDFPQASISEVIGRALVSIAVPLGGEEELQADMRTAFGTDLPAPGHSSRNKSGNARFLGMARDQFFILMDEPDGGGLEWVTERLGDAAYLTDQSDSWAAVSLTGTDCRSVLERICPLDLHPDAFAVGQVTRTVMEHLGVIILREGEDAYLLMSARSSAKSFLHALVTSAENI